MGSKALRYLVLFALLAPAIPFQCRQASERVLEARGRIHQVRSPYARNPLTSIVTGLQPEAVEAGLREGDQIVAIDGLPVTGLAPAARVLAAARPGQLLAVTVRRGGGDAPSLEQILSIQLAASGKAPAGAAQWLFVIVVYVVMPFLCLLLGAWVTLVRPREPIAWLLLALMLSFGRLGQDNPWHWEGWLAPLGIASHNLLLGTWFIWMMVFGIYFPERWSADRRWPWAKWILMVPLAGLSLLDAAIDAGRAEHMKSVAALHAALRPFGTSATVLRMLAVGLFFFALGFKMGTSPSPDARRRLKLLLAGTSASLTPMWMLVLYGLWQGTPPFLGVPVGMAAPALLMLLLFPVTLAYVIVVHRALDVGVVIRQGVQYALARGGVVGLQVLATTGVVLAMAAFARRPDLRRVELLAVTASGVTLIFMMRWPGGSRSGPTGGSSGTPTTRSRSSRS